MAATAEVYLARLHELRPCHADLLSVAETSRVSRFRQRADRDRFVLATALLRTAVSQQTGIAAGSVQVDRSCDQCGREHGRPRLPATGLAASISHSGELVAVAITQGSPVGVDIEAIRARDYLPLITSVCGAQERPFVRSAGDFYSYWTRKEAVLKATGEGLRIPMTRLHVSPPSSPAALVGLDGQSPACHLRDIAVGPGYAGAVAALTAEAISFEVLEAGPLLAA